MNPDERRAGADRFAELVTLATGIDASSERAVYGRHGCGVRGFDETIRSLLVGGIDFSQWSDVGLAALGRLMLQQSSDDDAAKLVARIDRELEAARYFAAHRHLEADAGHPQFASCSACARSSGDVVDMLDALKARTR